MDGADAVKYILAHNIDGAIVECGVDGGAFEYIWIKELQTNNVSRDIYLYDTFGGLTEPGVHDYTADAAVLYKMNASTVHDIWKSKQLPNNVNAWCYTPLEKVQDYLNSTGYPPTKLHYIVGDVMQTLQNPSNIPDKIAILRLDTDWYESSKCELQILYKNVVKGGVIIFDDYYHWDGQRRATDDFFTASGIVPNMVNIGNGKTAAMIKTE